MLTCLQYAPLVYAVLSLEITAMVAMAGVCLVAQPLIYNCIVNLILAVSVGKPGVQWMWVLHALVAGIPSHQCVSGV
jgi:hypothetical protein